MPQQINLYRHITLTPVYSLTTLLMLQITGIFLSVLMFACFYHFLVNVYLSEKYVSRRMIEMRNIQKLSKIGNLYPKAIENIKIENDIQNFQKTITDKTRALTLLKSGKTIKEPGFSTYLESLPHAIVPNIWLNTFSIDLNGKKIILMGSTFAPQNIMKFVQNMKKQTIFSDISFQNLGIVNSTASNGAVDFTLSTVPISSAKKVIIEIPK